VVIQQEALRAEIIKTPERFAEIQAAWTALHTASQSGPFSSHSWISSWMDVFLQPDLDVRIMVVWHDDMIVAAAPFAREVKKISQRLPFKVATLRMLYDDRVGFHDFLMVEGAEAAMALIFEQCRTSGNAPYMDVTPVRQSPALSAFVAHAKQTGCWHQQRDEIETAIADLSGGLDAYLGRRSSKTRKNFRHLERRIQKEGGEVLVATKDDAQGRAVLEALLDVSSRSWKAKAGTDIGSSDTDRQFFTNLFETMAPLGGIRLFVLKLDDTPVSAAINLVQDGISYGLVTDYDDSFAARGVGRFIGDTAIRGALEQGDSHLDMLRATHFTRSFCDTFEQYARVRIALRPGLARWVVQGEALARRASQKLHAGKPKLSGRRKILGERK